MKKFFSIINRNWDQIYSSKLLASVCQDGKEITKTKYDWFILFHFDLNKKNFHSDWNNWMNNSINQSINQSSQNDSLRRSTFFLSMLSSYWIPTLPQGDNKSHKSSHETPILSVQKPSNLFFNCSEIRELVCLVKFWK